MYYLHIFPNDMHLKIDFRRQRKVFRALLRTLIAFIIKVEYGLNFTLMIIVVLVSPFEMCP